MAEKEATVFVVDIGKSTGDTKNGRSMSDLEWSLQYFWERICGIVGTNRKTLNVGVIGLRTDGTDNEKSDDPNYQNITVLQGIQQVLMPNLRHLGEELKPSATNQGDTISALILAIKMLEEKCKHLKWKKHIYLLTNGLAACDMTGYEKIADKLKSYQVSLTILGVDFDDEDYTENNKPIFKQKNEMSLKKLADAAEGVFATMAAAIDDIKIPRIKEVRPVPNFKGQMTLGGPDYPTTMVIDVERYPKVMVAKPQSASSFAKVTNMAADGQTSMQSSVTLDHVNGEAVAPIKFNREYYVEDEKKNEKMVIDQDELAKGFAYGATAVPISESDQNVTRLETKAGLEIIGFIPSDKFEPLLPMSTTYMITPQNLNERATVALSSLIHALHELQSYAVARFVQKAGKDPVILLMAPHIEQGYECLYDVQLPFAEDLRMYNFAPIDHIKTTSGKIVKEHRNLPNKELKDCMSNYIDAMDIEGDPEDEELVQIESSYSPILHRLNAAIYHRATHPLDKLPPIQPILLRPSHPPSTILKAADSALKALTQSSKVQKVEAERKSRKLRDRPKPLSGLDIDALLGPKPSQSEELSFDKTNAIPEFKRYLERALTDTQKPVKEVCQKAASAFIDIIVKALPSSSKVRAFESGSARERLKIFDRIVEHIRVMREELQAYEEPNVYNEGFLRLRDVFRSAKDQPEMMELWGHLRRHRLGQITKSLSEFSQLDGEKVTGEWDL